jgi:hypothetical protein
MVLLLKRDQKGICRCSRSFFFLPTTVVVDEDKKKQVLCLYKVWTTLFVIFRVIQKNPSILAISNVWGFDSVVWEFTFKRLLTMLRTEFSPDRNGSLSSLSNRILTRSITRQPAGSDYFIDACFSTTAFRGVFKVVVSFVLHYITRILQSNSKSTGRRLENSHQCVFK